MNKDQAILINVLWFLFSGEVVGIIWVIFGAIICVSVQGVPVGVNVIKLSYIAFFPFGKKVDYNEEEDVKTRSLNYFWCGILGWILGTFHCIFGLCWCFTIIGIPFGLQHFLLARVAFWPGGGVVVSEEEYNKKHMVTETDSIESLSDNKLQNNSKKDDSKKKPMIHKNLSIQNSRGIEYTGQD